jgi:dolichyldiphosphatase
LLSWIRYAQKGVAWPPADILQTQPIVIGLTAACLLYTRSAGVGHFVAGASTCTFTVKLIKRTIRQPRPPPSLAGRKAKASYG